MVLHLVDEGPSAFPTNQAKALTAMFDELLFALVMILPLGVPSVLFIAVEDNGSIILDGKC
jgi:hypothetical protein